MCIFPDIDERTEKTANKTETQEKIKDKGQFEASREKYQKYKRSLGHNRN
jgi:hypothetical protein